MQQTRTKGVQGQTCLDGKVIHWELRLKFVHTTKWYMHKPESGIENETNKIL